MRGRRAKGLGQVLSAGLLAAWPAWAGPPNDTPTVTVRAGEHPDFSRVVFTLPPGIAARSAQLGELLVLTFPNAGAVPGLPAPPAHLLSVTGGLNQAALGVAAGVHTHVWQIDRRVIVDVFAAPQARP